MEKFFYKQVFSHEKDLMAQIFRLRFQVYARECHYIKEEDYPTELEIDDYDDQALHFAAMNSEGEVIGTMRMILAGKLFLPVEKYCPSIAINRSLSTKHFTEISRLVISKNFRRRKNDALFYEPQVEDQKIVDDNNKEYLRRAKPMVFGLYREMYQVSRERGITRWYSLMEKSLWLLLRIHGFMFEPIGEEIDLYGPVRPYSGEIVNIEKEVAQRFPNFFAYFTERMSVDPNSSLTLT